eukprot:scaffold4095_cov255-Prasinococcus_capsulatus_cf.AAC.2
MSVGSLRGQRAPPVARARVLPTSQGALWGRQGDRETGSQLQLHASATRTYIHDLLFRHTARAAVPPLNHSPARRPGQQQAASRKCRPLDAARCCQRAPGAGAAAC